MKKIAILILSILIAGLFVACNQDITVDAQTYANMEVGTFVLNGQNYATLQAAVDAIGSKAAGDNVIRLTKNASGPGAKIANKDVTIDFQGYTYSFTNVNGLQGQDVTGKDFGLSITTGSDVVLKGLQKIDLNDKTTTDLTMVYVEGSTTSLTIEDAPKMEVANSQYVFWAANGATLTIGGKDASESATVTGKVAATGTSLQMPTVTVQGATNISGAVEATSANIKMDDSAKVTGAIEVSNTQVIVDGDSKIEASLKATDSANVTINSKDNVITTLDKTSNSTVTITETIKVEEVSTGSEDSTIVIAGDDSVKVVDEAGTQQTEMEDRTTEKDAVAVIGKTFYETLDAAVAAAQSGDTIKILQNISEQGHGYVISKDLAIDTNGKTITFLASGAGVDYETKPTNSRAFKVESGSLTVYGGGIVDAKASDDGTSGYYGAFRVEAKGSLSLEDVTLKNGRKNGLNVKVLGGTATLSKVTINSTYGGGIEVTEADLGAQSQTGKASLDNCTFTQTQYHDWCSTTLSVSGGSELVVNSGTYTSDNYALYVFSSGGVIDVKGGTFSGNKDGVAIIAEIDTGTYPEYVGGLEISGGSFTGGYKITSPAYMSLTGGTYSVDPSKYVVYGYKAVDNGDGTWTVKKAEAVAINERTEKQYYTVQKAIDEADSGDTVKLLANVSENFSLLTDNKTIFLDLNGCNEGDSVNLCTVKLGSESTIIITGSGIVWVDVEDSVVSAQSLKLRGGTYNVDLTDYVDDGFVIEEIEGPMWKVHAVASITKNGTTTYYSTLPGAVDAAESGDTVDLHVDVNLSSVLMIEKSLTLNGNEKTVNTTATRGIRLGQGNIAVTIKNLVLKGSSNTERGIQVDSDKAGVKLSLINCEVSGITHYGINVCNGSSVELVIDGCTITAWSAVNLWSAQYDVVINNSTLNGINDKSYNKYGWNDFATIVLEGDTTGKTEDHSSYIDVKITNTIITAQSTTKNKQALIGFNSPSTSNNVSLENCTLELDGSIYTYKYYDHGTDNSLTVSNQQVDIASYYHDYLINVRGYDAYIRYYTDNLYGAYLSIDDTLSESNLYYARLEKDVDLGKNYSLKGLSKYNNYIFLYLNGHSIDNGSYHLVIADKDTVVITDSYDSLLSIFTAGPDGYNVCEDTNGEDGPFVYYLESISE